MPVMFSKAWLDTIMRRWHRWLALLFGAFLLWIAITGVLSHVVEWSMELLLTDPRPHGPPHSAVDPNFVCPSDMICRLRPSPHDASMRSLVGLFHGLHSGEFFGPVGVLISTFSGVAMVFFSFSGLWLYIQMFLNRKNRALKPRWFWK